MGIVQRAIVAPYLMLRAGCFECYLVFCFAFEDVR